MYGKKVLIKRRTIQKMVAIFEPIRLLVYWNFQDTSCYESLATAARILFDYVEQQKYTLKVYA